MKTLDIDRAEAEEVYKSDYAIDHDERQEFDLSPEKEEIARKFAYTGTRETKKPTAYEFKKRERKPNATKGGLIEELSNFLSNDSQFDIINLTIPNKEGKISFSIGETNFSITLTQHRNKK